MHVGLAALEFGFQHLIDAEFACGDQQLRAERDAALGERGVAHLHRRSITDLFTGDLDVDLLGVDALHQVGVRAGDIEALLRALARRRADDTGVDHRAAHGLQDAGDFVHGIGSDGVAFDKHNLATGGLARGGNRLGVGDSGAGIEHRQYHVAFFHQILHRVHVGQPGLFAERTRTRAAAVGGHAYVKAHRLDAHGHTLAHVAGAGDANAVVELHEFP